MDINNLQRTPSYSYRVDVDKIKQRIQQADKNSVSDQRQSDSINISEEGRKALKERASAIKRFGQSEEVKKLSPTSAYGIMNEFEKIMSEPGEENATGTDTFDRYVDKMASAYQVMRDRIEEKYAASDRQKEYYVAADGSRQEMTKERELEMLDEAYGAHSLFMATSTQIWSELQDFKAQITYHSGSAKAETHVTKNKDTSIKEQAYNAFMTAIHAKNNDISSPARDVLNGIWDYFANINHHNK